MRVSISSYSFHGLLKEGAMDVFGFLESCKHRYGVDAVEIWNGTLGGRMDQEYLRAVRRALDERDLTLANLCVDGAHLWEDEPDAREKNYRSALAYLLWFRVLALIPPGRAAVYLFLIPLVSCTLAVAFLREPFTLRTGLGTLLVLAGVFGTDTGSGNR